MQNCPPYSPMIHDNANSVVTREENVRQVSSLALRNVKAGNLQYSDCNQQEGGLLGLRRESVTGENDFNDRDLRHPASEALWILCLAPRKIGLPCE